MAIYAELADGRVLEFPDGTDPSVVQRTVKNLIASETPPEEGVGAALKGGAKRFASTIQTGIESLFDAEAAAKAGLERQKAISEQYAPGADLEAVKRAYAERGLLPAAGEAISQIPGALAEQFPNIAAALASGRAGAIAGGRVGGVRGALVGGVTGAAAPSLAQLFGSGLERQAEEGADISRGRALAAAVPGAALETAATFIPLGRTLVGKILGPQAEAALVRGNRAAVERMAKESLAGAAARGVGVGALAEIPTEITQQILERAQAGLDLTSDDALAEYGQAAYGAGLVGGPFGALGRVGQRSVARGEIEQEEAARRKEEARVAAEEQRLADEAEVQRKLTPEYRQELNAEIVAAKDELTQIQAVLKDKTVDAEVKKEAQARAKELAATVKEKTAELNKSAREAGVAPTLTEALAKQTKAAGAEPVVVDDFGNVLKPKTQGLTEEEVAAGYEQQAKKTLDYFAERERLLDELRAKEQERKEKADAELQTQVQTFLQQSDELAEQEFGPAAYTAKLAEEMRKAGNDQAAQEITLNRINLVLQNFGLRAAGLKADERQAVEEKVNEGTIDRKVTSVLGIKGLGGRTVTAAEAIPNLEARIQEIQDQRQKALVGKDPLMLDNGQLTEKGYGLVASEAKLNELNKLLGIAKQQSPEETAAEAALGPAIERAGGEADEAIPVAKKLPGAVYQTRIEESNKKASGAFDDLLSYVDDLSKKRFFGGAPGQIGLASSTEEGLRENIKQAKKRIVDGLLEEIATARVARKMRPLSKAEAYLFVEDVAGLVDTLVERSLAPAPGMVTETVTTPAQVRGTKIITGATETEVDTRTQQQLPFGATLRTKDVVAGLPPEQQQKLGEALDRLRKNVRDAKAKVAQIDAVLNVMQPSKPVAKKGEPAPTPVQRRAAFPESPEAQRLGDERVKAVDALRKAEQALAAGRSAVKGAVSGVSQKQAVQTIKNVIRSIKQSTIAEGKRPVRAEKPLLKQQFKTQPTESQIAQGTRVVNEIDEVLAGDVNEGVAAVLNQAADIIANRRANPTFLNTVDEQIDRIRTGIDKTDKPENLALFKEIKQDLDTQAAIRAFVEGEPQADLFPETKATERTTPERFRKYQQSKEVQAKRDAIAQVKQLEKDLRAAKREADAEAVANLAQEEKNIFEEITKLADNIKRGMGDKISTTNAQKFAALDERIKKLVAAYKKKKPAAATSKVAENERVLNKLLKEADTPEPFSLTATSSAADFSAAVGKLRAPIETFEAKIKAAADALKEVVNNPKEYEAKFKRKYGKDAKARVAKLIEARTNFLNNAKKQLENFELILKNTIAQPKEADQKVETPATAAQLRAAKQAMATRIDATLKRLKEQDAALSRDVRSFVGLGLGLPGTRVVTEFETVTAGGKEYTRQVRKVARIKSTQELEEERAESLRQTGRITAPSAGDQFLSYEEELDQAIEERNAASKELRDFTKLVNEAKQAKDFKKYEADFYAKLKELADDVEKKSTRVKALRQQEKVLRVFKQVETEQRKNPAQRTVTGPITEGEKRVIGSQGFDILGYGKRFGGPRTYDVDGTVDLRLGDEKPEVSVEYATAEKRLKEVKARVDEILKAGFKAGTDKEKKAPTFEFYPSVPQAPKKISAAMAAQGLDPLTDSVKGGVLPDGSVFVIVDAHDSMLDLEQTIAHELIGHYSFESLLGKSGIEKLMLKLDKDLATKENESGLENLAKDLGLTNEYNEALFGTNEFYKEQLDKGEISEKEVRRIAKANGMREIVAYTMEKRVDQKFVDKAKRWLKELVGAVRALFRKLGLPGVAEMSTSDLFYLMKQAHDNFTAGKPMAYRNEDGTVSFRSQKMSPAEGVSKAIGVNDEGSVKGMLSLGSSSMSSLAFRTKILDRFAPIQELVKRGVDKGIIDSLKAFNVMYFSRMADQRNNFSAQALTNGVGDIQKVQGELKYVGRDGASMKKVAERLSKGDSGVLPADLEREFTAYAVARRAKRVGVDKLDYAGANITQADVDATLNKYKGNKAFEEAFELYQDYNKDLLNFAAKTGFLSQKEADDLSSTRDYVPYYRVRGQEIELYLGKGERIIKVGNINNNPDLAQLVGGKEKILPIFQSAALNTQMLIGRSVNNMALRNAAWAIRDLGIAKGNAVSKGPGAGDPNTIRFKEDGEWKHVVVDTQLKSDLFGDIPTELVIQGIEGIPTAIPFVVRMMSKPANLLRKFITRNPKYAVNQIYRDSMAASMTTGANFIPVFDTLKNLTQILSKKSVTAKELQGSGILGGQVVTGMPEDIQKIINQISTGRTGWELAMAKLDEVAMAADTATRVSMYNSFIKQGLSPRMAEYATLEAMNFSRRGTSPSMHFLNMMIPFFNANVQGLDVLWRAYKGDMPESQRLRVKQKLIARGIMMGAFTVAYAAMWQDDEAYENANPDERYSNWFIPIPGLREPLRVPIPFELGFIFKAIPEGTYRALMSDDKVGNIAVQMKNMFLRSTPLVDPGGALGITPELPAGIKPIIEVVMNKDLFSDRPIVDARLEKLETEQQYRDSTPAVVKALAPVYGIFGISPVQLEHLIRGYTGSLPLALSKTLDFILPGVEKPSIKLTEFPVVGTMFQPVDAGGLVNAAYKVVEDAQKASATYKDLLVRNPKEAQAYLQANLARVSLASAAGQFRQQMGEFAAAKRQINASNMPADKKREQLDAIRKMEIAYAKQFTSVSERIRSQ